MALDLSVEISKFRNQLTDRTFMKAIGVDAKDIIYKRVKAGFGVSNDEADTPNKVGLLALQSQKYIDFRKRVGVKGKFGAPERSNLTFTGQMLESMEVSAEIGGFTISIPASRRDDGLTNEDVADRVRVARPFFALTGAEVRILQQTFLKRAREIVERVFSTKKEV